MKLLLVMALLPPILLILYVWRVDKNDKESPGFVAKIVLYGAISGLIAGAIEELVAEPIYLLFGADMQIYLFAEYFIGVGLVEEFVKILVVMIWVWKSRDFNYSFDGIVYCVASSLGFAALENVMYVFEGGFDTAVMRAFTAIPGHAVDGVIMGFFVGLAKAQLNLRKRRTYLVVALLVPTCIHGFYDFLLAVPYESAFSIWFIYLIASFIVAFVIVRHASRNDKLVCASL